MNDVTREEIMKTLTERLGDAVRPLVKLDLDELYDLEQALDAFQTRVRCDAQDLARVWIGSNR